MNLLLAQHQDKSILDDAQTLKKVSLNYHKNKEQDNTEKMDKATSEFRYEDCRGEYWNPEEYSLFYGTPLWAQASKSQRIILNQLYWVAYYSQIVSAEIATILLNQTSAAGLSTLEDFRAVCDMLDLESAQERAHIHAFKKISEDTEAALFGERFFTYPMRSMFVDTIIFYNSNVIKQFWKSLQLRAFSMLSSGNAFIGCQYFTVRGIRTLNGKIIQHALSQYYMKHPDKENSPIPSKISFYHFMDESFHFNSSGIISHDVLKSLKAPTAFESWVANAALRGCQQDHYYFSSAIKGIFWYDPALYSVTYKLLRSHVFNMNDSEAKRMMRDCFTEESEALHQSYKIHKTAAASYCAYLEPINYVTRENKQMSHMNRSSITEYLATNRKALEKFIKTR